MERIWKQRRVCSPGRSLFKDHSVVIWWRIWCFKRGLWKQISWNQDFFESKEDNTGYSFNLANTKPEAGFYKLDFSIVPDNAKKLKVTSELKHQIVTKVLTQVAVADIQLAVSDSGDSADLSEARIASFEYPETRKQTVRVDQRYLHLEFKVKNKITNRALFAHQTFVKFASVDNPSLEVVVVAKLSDKRNVFTLDTKESGEELFGSHSGEYKVSLIIGDPFIHNTVNWQLGAVSFTFPKPSTSKSKNTGSIYKTLSDIEHTFAKEQSKPLQSISYTFTALVLSPFLILIVGFLSLGANIGNFPTSGNKLLNAIGFQVSLLAIVLLYVQYWLSLNAFEVVGYLAFLIPVTVVLGQRALSDLSSSIDVKK